MSEVSQLIEKAFHIVANDFIRTTLVLIFVQNILSVDLFDPCMEKTDSIIFRNDCNWESLILV